MESLKLKVEPINDSLFSVRKLAFEQYEKNGFPTTKDENWKYTNLSNFLKKDFAASAKDVDQKIIENFLFKNIQANHLVFANGIFQEATSVILDKNIIIKDFNKALKENPDIVTKYFSKSATNKNSLLDLNTAIANQGILIHIPEGVKVEHPILIYYIAHSDNAISTNIRNLLIAEANSQANIFELYLSNSPYDVFNNIVTEIFVKEKASLTNQKIQIENTNIYSISNTLVTQEKESSFTNNTVTVAGHFVRNDLRVELNGKFANCYMNGLYITSEDKQLIDNHTFVDHAVPNCYSNELYKGVLNKRSTGIFNGKILVRQDAQKTNAFQSNKNILLSDDASINTKPELEIFADDIKCSHGATTGQLDKEALFYLRARGISEQNAKVLLTNAFAEEIINKIDIETIKDFVKEKVGEKLIL